MKADKFPEYDRLEAILRGAYLQAAQGKGKQRHAIEGEFFEKQPLVEIGLRLADNPAAGPLFQAVKKIYESSRLHSVAAIRELEGAIVYIAAAIEIIQQTEKYRVETSPLNTTFSKERSA